MIPKIALNLGLFAVLLLALAGFSAIALAGARQADSSSLKTQSVVLIVLDGLRWQEVFDGPDASLMDKDHGGVEDPAALRREFWRDTPEERRKAVLPFLWGTVAQKGVIFGNQHRDSIARVTNGLKFSYPGYNEMLAGHPDPRIDKNDFGPNPNATVFEWLDSLPALHGSVAVFATWNTFADIFNVRRSGLFVQAGWLVSWPSPLTPRETMLKELYDTTTHIDSDGVLDSFMQAQLLDYLETNRPRALFVGFGETDDWGHNGRYDLLLESAHHDDQGIAALWDRMQAAPAYQGHVTFIITTDHGRGNSLEQWKRHGKDVDGAENIWIAVIGPDTPPLGELANAPPVTQSQIAATVAAFLGGDYRSAVPSAAPPLPLVLGFDEAASPLPVAKSRD